ncbi:hypothetical protein C2E25_11580 [Geothermobacter hydrogeniphilus]|uniref:HAMP domain-containing protein n=1 Tax=Geothermobacter hydrogeniphilus TaxID=1969733 RepID=A0A2K2H8M1_9BACT|nr:SpoIIE family protein phosphatase [Geothermobacter hydrogeniphilus]PNU19573.1 hypothetical protein C2E25_11580 [Geothermobacter hydrogeniphilus]
MALKFRGKLLTLLLVIALAPLILSSVLHGLSMRQLGRQLAAETRTYLERSALEHLQSMVDNYNLLLQRDRTFLTAALNSQVREVERRLAAKEPSMPALQASVSVADFDAGRGPADLAPSERHLHFGRDGELTPMPVSFSAQSYHVAPGGSSSAAGLARLGDMPEVYNFFRRLRPDLFQWQYTSLQSGLHTSYPGHGGIPADFDPRTRPWYRQAKETDAPVRLMLGDATTHRLMLVLAAPVHNPDGSFAGVTGIDIASDRPLSDWRLPDAWAQAVDTMVLSFHPDAAPDKKLEIMLHGREDMRRYLWRRAEPKNYLVSADREKMAALCDDLANGQGGVRKLSYRGEQAYWAYATAAPGEPVALVVVPYELVTAQAEKAGSYVLQQVVRGLRVAGILLLGVAAWVVVTAVLRARAVTRPVASLAAAAGKLAEGDFNARVEIRTGDEFEELGAAFNRVGPQLQERQQMKQSLLVAREIQQLLLPDKVPDFPGLQIAGGISYCDEIGGDYYDFIHSGENYLGVVVGDVVGHGVGAALLMASVSGALRSSVASGSDNLEELFGWLNRFLSEDVGDTRFMTLFYARFDLARQSLCWISAGHGPVYYYRADCRSIEELSVVGVPLGIMNDADYPESCREPLRPGDVLAIGTDGIWEARNAAGEQFGEDRFLELLQDNVSAPAEEIYRIIIGAVHDFLGREAQEDDITLVIVKAT